MQGKWLAMTKLFGRMSVEDGGHTLQEANRAKLVTDSGRQAGSDNSPNTGASTEFKERKRGGPGTN